MFGCLKSSQHASNEALWKKNLENRWSIDQFLPLQQRERFTFTLLHLIHGALARGFVRTPAKKSCAVSKAPTGEMVVGNFNDYFRSDGFPLAGAVRTPTAGSSWRVASESRCFL
jgi:hypothetical protein